MTVFSLIGGTLVLCGIVCVCLSIYLFWDFWRRGKKRKAVQGSVAFMVGAVFLLLIGVGLLFAR